MIELAGYKIRPFVLVVPEVPERTDKIQKHFKERGLEVENFYGLSSALSGLRTVHPYEVDAPGSGYTIGPKNVVQMLNGCMLWTALGLMPEQHFMSLDWDAQFPEEWKPRLEKALRDVPADFDVLSIGSCCTKGKPMTHIAGDIWEVKYPMCGHGLIYSKKAFPVLLKTQRKIYAPADIAMMTHSYPLLKVYTVLPRLVEQFDTPLAE